MATEDSREPFTSMAPAARISLPPGGKAARAPEAMSFVMDVPVEITVEIGRRAMKIADVLRLGPGSILELDKPSGEPLELLVNNRAVARGEAVVVGDRYGIRITEVLVSQDRGDR